MKLNVLIEQIEKVSNRYSKKFKIDREANWYMLKLQEEVGELTQSYLSLTGKNRDKGKSKHELKNDFEKEIADVFCHTLLLAKSNKVNIEKAIKDKWLKWTGN